MPFVLSDKKTYRFKVTVHRPNDETGKWDAFEFLAEFRRRSQPELKAMFLKRGLYEKGDRAEVVAGEFAGWSDIKQPDGSNLEVNDANRTLLLAEPHVEKAIYDAWFESALTGPAKN